MIVKSFKHFQGVLRGCSETLIWGSTPLSAASSSLTHLNTPSQAGKHGKSPKERGSHQNAAWKHLQGQAIATEVSFCVCDKRSQNRVALGQIRVSDAVRSVENTLCFVVMLHKEAPNKMFLQQLPLVWVRLIKAVFVRPGRRMGQISFCSITGFIRSELVARLVTAGLTGDDSTAGETVLCASRPRGSFSGVFMVCK